MTSDSDSQKLASSSHSTLRAKLEISKNMWLPPVNLDNIEILTGHQNYEDWADQLSVVLDAMQLSEIVIEGKDLPENADEEDREVLKMLRGQALLVLIQLMSKPIFKNVAKMRDPHQIWNYLRETYRRDIAFSLVPQIRVFTSLHSAYEPSEPHAIATFIGKFETEWARLLSFTAGSSRDSYRTKFRELLEEDKAKRDFLLGFLVKHHENLVHDLTTKDSLSYSDVVMELHWLSSSYSDSFVAYKASRQKQKDRDTDHKKKECSYCKSHKLGNPEGHNWRDCRKLKAKQDAERKKEESGQGKKKDSPLMLRVRTPTPTPTPELIMS